MFATFGHNKMVRIGQKAPKMAKNAKIYTKLPKMAKTPKIAQNCTKLHKMAKFAQNGTKLLKDRRQFAPKLAINYKKYAAVLRKWQEIVKQIGDN
jgi:hypothetical protein